MSRRDPFRLWIRWQAPSRPRADPSNRTDAIASADRLRDAGSWDEAARAYAAILDDTPFLTGIRVQLGNMLKDSGRPDEAEAAYRQALTESPDDADIHMQLGHALKLMGRRPAALAAYRRAASLDPSNLDALRELRSVGDPSAETALFDRHLRGGGAEAVLTVAAELAALREQLDRIDDRLPELRSFNGFPVECYAQFRQLHDIPIPPAAPVTTITIVLTPDPARSGVLYDQLAALRAQSMGAWRAVVTGTDPDQRMAVLRAAAADFRIVWLEADVSASPAGAEAAAAAASEADWLVLPAPNAVPHPHALGWILAAGQMAAADAFVFDEETIDRRHGSAMHRDPVLRQAFDRDTLLARNVFGLSIAIRRDAYRAVPADRESGTIAAYRTDLLLHTPRIGHIPYPLVWFAPDREPPDPDRAAHAGAIDRYRARHTPVSNTAAPIAVIIPTRDNAGDVAAFTQSLSQLADHPAALSILVLDNGSTPPMRAMLDRLTGPGLRVVSMAEPFNWSRLNNAAARQTDAPLLLFANDDMRMLTPGWDTVLRDLLRRNEIGAVGAKLLYDDDTIQHAGVLMGWQGFVTHDGLFAPATAPGPTDRWQLPRAVGAVTGAFLATRRADFLAIGGFDEAALPIAYNDVDFCLKLRAAGKIVFWTPAISLYHHESKSRGLDHADPAKQARNAAERLVMERRWGKGLLADPGMHPGWLDATLPFRLIAAPSAARMATHIRRAGAAEPWRIDPPRA